MCYQDETSSKMTTYTRVLLGFVREIRSGATKQEANILQIKEQKEKYKSKADDEDHNDGSISSETIMNKGFHTKNMVLITHRWTNF